MSADGFKLFAKRTHNVRGAGTASSYIKAIKILDDIFAQQDVFGMNGTSLTELKDPELVDEILNFIRREERKFKNGENSIFQYGNPNQTSYPRKYFCSAAVNCLAKYVSHQITEQVPDILNNAHDNKVALVKSLNRLVGINSTETPSEVRRRIGQDVFRKVILSIYGSKCCLTGLEVPETLRASHIVAWAYDKKNRLNPENGLCLSATYDAAFDKHLITFDEDYRMVLSPCIRDHYTSNAFKEYFKDKEGARISLPSQYLPNQSLLQKHRDKLIQ